MNQTPRLQVDNSGRYRWLILGASVVANFGRFHGGQFWAHRWLILGATGGQFWAHRWLNLGAFKKGIGEGNREEGNLGT